MTDKQNITAILECNFAGFKEEIIESACNLILNLKHCEDCVSRADVETFLDKYNFVSYDYTVEDLVKALPSIYPKTDVLDKIRAEIERQEKWLLQAGCTTYNVDIAFDSIKSVLAESEE